MLIVKIIENNTIYSVQELHLCFFSSSAELHSANVIPAIFASSIFSVHYSTNLSRKKGYFFYIYSFYNLNILQHRMIYGIHTPNYLDSK